MTRVPPAARRRRRPARGSAFTLVELMISIALVVVLILGINQVFKYTSDAVGAGEAVNSGVRDGRAVQTTLANDFAGILPNGGSPTDAAFITIRSAATFAYADAKDQAGDRDADPTTIDLNGDGKEGDPAVPGEKISPATYNSRNHRLDTLGFFARGSFPRQTGNDGTFVANMTSPEAYVSYGHLWLPDNAGNFGDPTTGGTAGDVSTYPGAVDNNNKPNPAANPNNAFASQFVLGRVAMLLREPTFTGAGAEVIYDNSVSPTSQVFTKTVADPQGSGWTSPLFATPTGTGSAQYSASSSAMTVGGVSQSLKALNQSRFDLADMSIRQVQASLNSQYYAKLATPGQSVYNDKWWQSLIGMGVASGTPPNATAVESRFQCNPFVAKPLTAAGMAQATPYFLKGCSQFTVEYAGDFVQQENDPQYSVVGNANLTNSPKYGDPTQAGVDGQLDYVLVPPTPGSTVSRSLWRRQIRWYGLPRSTAGLTTITAKNGDVVPLRDVIENEAVVSKSTAPATFEKTVPTYCADYASAAAGMAPNQAYTCVFGPNDPAPKLIRVTVTVADPTGRLPDGQTYQYVFPVQPQ